MQVLIVYYLLFRKIVFVYESLFDVVLPLNHHNSYCHYLLKFITIYYWYCCAAYLIKMSLLSLTSKIDSMYAGANHRQSNWKVSLTFFYICIFIFCNQQYYLAKLCSYLIYLFKYLYIIFLIHSYNIIPMPNIK